MYINRFLTDSLEEILDLFNSILLLGPRQVGKSTLIKELLNSRKEKVISYKLQNPQDLYEIHSSPGIITKRVELEVKTNQVILFIDEIQKCPELLDECQYLIDEYKNKLKVILTGSSARKLKRKGINLLPGRVIVENLHTLILPEILKQSEQLILPVKNKLLNPTLSKIDLKEILLFGLLPGVFKSPSLKGKILKSYITTYLEEEIRQEALTRNMSAFAKFLELSALESNRVLNFSHISSDSGIPVNTVKNYFHILEDTLITFSIPPFTAKTRKQVLSTPKYIYFDTGVKNAIINSFPDKKNLHPEQAGKLFEEFVILELIKRIKYHYPSYKYSYWRTNQGIEIDFIIQTPKEIIPIEIKYTKVSSESHIKHLKIFMDEFNVNRGFLIGDFRSPHMISKNITAIPWNYI